MSFQEDCELSKVKFSFWLRTDTFLHPQCMEESFHTHKTIFSFTDPLLVVRSKTYLLAQFL